MTGREERMLKLEKQNQAYIQKLPQLLQNFYYSMSKLSPTTKYQYLNQINICLKEIFGEEYTDQEILSVDMDTINRYITSRTQEITSKGKVMGESIINGQLYALNKLYNYLLESNKISRNPINVKSNRSAVPDKERVIYLTMDEAQNVIQAIKSGVGSNKAKAYQKKWISRDLAIFILLFCKGMRVSALVDLNISDVDFEKHELHVVDKRKKTMNFLLTQEDEDVIANWLADRETFLSAFNTTTDALFITRYNGGICRMTSDNVGLLIKKFTGSVGHKISPHKLRSSFGTTYYEMSEDLALTQEAMGHSNIQTTRRYVAQNKERRNTYMAQISQAMLQQK